MPPPARRTLLYLAAITAVTALIIPTGALTSTNIDRSINGQVAPNEHGYIGIQTNRPLELHYGRNDGDVKGSAHVANSSVTLFVIRNQLPKTPPITTLEVTVAHPDTRGPPPFILPHTLDYPDEIRDTAWHPVTGSIVCGANTDSMTAIELTIQASGSDFDITVRHTITIICVGPPANASTSPTNTTTVGTNVSTNSATPTTS